MSKSSGKKTIGTDAVLCAMPEAYLTRARVCVRILQNLTRDRDFPMSHDVFVMCGGKPLENPDGTFNKKRKYSTYAMSVAADDGLEVLLNHPPTEQVLAKAKTLMLSCDKKYAQQPIDVSKLKLEYVDPSDKTAAAAATAAAVVKSTDASDAVASPIARAAGPSDGTTTSDKSSSGKQKAMDAIFGSASAQREVLKMSPKKKMVKKLHIDNSGDDAMKAALNAGEEEEKEVEEAVAEDDDEEAGDEEAGEAEAGEAEAGEEESGEEESGQAEAGEEETEEEEEKDDEEEEEEEEEDEEEEGDDDDDDDDDEDYHAAEDGEEDGEEDDEEDEEDAAKA